MTFLRGHDAAVFQVRKDLCLAAYLFDNGRPDEDRVIGMGCVCRLLQFGNVEIGFEGIDLAAKRVARYFDVHQAKQGLVATHVFGKEDRACAGSPNGVGFSELAQGFH